jgi:GDP-4-dehydro-6-deoxy-D-mannose reductase
MRILITGVSGFAGRHLAEATRAHYPGAEVFGTIRRIESASHLDRSVQPLQCDLAAGGPALVEMLRAARPDRIFHLAGYAAVGRSFKEPDAAWDNNLLATRRLYGAVAAWGGHPRILFVGSGLVYGDGDPSRPLDEDSPLHPLSPYAASKAAADLLSYQVGRETGLEILRARPFNHIGPGQSPEFALASFARQLALIERDRQAPVLEVGDLSPRRDLADVRDVAAAYLALMDRGRPGDAYNIASGESRSIGDVLERLTALSGCKVELRRRADLARSADPSLVTADAGKLRRETGWRPRFQLDQTLRDLLTYWRGHIKSQES